MAYDACQNCRVIGNFGSVAGEDRLAYLRNERPGNLVQGEFADHNDFTDPPAHDEPLSPPQTHETVRVNGVDSPPPTWGIPFDPLRAWGESPPNRGWGESPTGTNAWFQASPSRQRLSASPFARRWPSHPPDEITNGAAVATNAESPAGEESG